MDTQRLILFVVFSFSLLLLWEAWQKETKPSVATAPATQGAVPTPSARSDTPAARGPEVPLGATPADAAPRERLSVVTDVVRAEIDTQGGDISYLEFLRQKDARDGDKNFVLFGPEHRYAAQSGLIGAGLPNHRTQFRAKAKEFALAPGQDKVEVRLEADGPPGVKVAKILTFHRGSYRIDLAHEITNKSGAPLSADAYFQLTRDGKSPGGDPYMTQTYTGAAVYTERDKFQKVTFDDIAKGKVAYPKTAADGWIALIQHYFVAALLPPEKAQREFFTRKLDSDLYAAGVIMPVGPIAPGATARVGVSLYAGPQDQDHLKLVAPGLQLVVDYGWLTVIAAPLFWVLKLFHGWMGNWGLA